MLLARLVAVRYGYTENTYQGRGNASTVAKASWLSRLLGTILHRKSPA